MAKFAKHIFRHIFRLLEILHKGKQMQLIGASLVFVCDEDFTIIKNGGVVFEDGWILAVGEYKELESKLESNTDFSVEFSEDFGAEFDAKSSVKSSADFDKNFGEISRHCLDSSFGRDFVLDFAKRQKNKKRAKKPIKKQFFSDCVLLPAFVNAHIHFEFGANTTSFAYGSFEAWLASVMSYRGGVLEKLESVLKKQITTQLECGVGSVGAISSYGGDMLALAHSPLRVSYFCEVLGASEVDESFARFRERFESAFEAKSERFIPRVAIHSPYSVHSALAKNVIDFATQKSSAKPIISAHFLESASEREWLESKSGWFRGFYADTLKIPNPKPLYEISEFLELFSGVQAVLTHCVVMSEAELERILDAGHFITTCPRSNRLLGGKMLDIAHFRRVDSRFACSLAIGTDGASSNVDTNLLDEMRSALFGLGLCEGFGLGEAAKLLLLSATRYGAQALGLENGELKRGKYADFALFGIPKIADSATPILHFLTNAKKVDRLYINGEVVVKR